MLIGLAVLSMSGCTSAPRARSYTIRVGETIYHAKSFKIRGDWISIEVMPPPGTSGSNAVVVAPLHSLVSIQQN